MRVNYVMSLRVAFLPQREALVLQREIFVAHKEALEPLFHLLFGRRGVRSGGERRSRHLPGTGAHVLGGWRDHTGLWAIGQVR